MIPSSRGLWTSASLPARSQLRLYSSRLQRAQAVQILPATHGARKPLLSPRQAASPSSEQLAQSTPSKLPSIDVWQNVARVVKGVVTKVKASGAAVDVGAKKAGFLDVKSISGSPVQDAQDVFVVGEEVKVFVTKPPVDNGTLRLSTMLLEPSPGDMLRDKSMVFAKAEETVQQRASTGQLVRREVAISEKDFKLVAGKGGTGLRDVTKESGARLSWHRSSNTMIIWGSEEQVNKAEELLQARPQQNEAEQQARIAERPDLPAHLEYGQVVSGVVQQLLRRGCIIQFDGAVGVLDVRNISHERVKDIKEVFGVGEAVKALILKVDREKKRVQLSTKALEPSPGDMLRDKQLVFSKAEETGAAFVARAAEPPASPE